MHDAKEQRWLEFGGLQRVFCTYDLPQVKFLLDQVQEAVDAGQYAAGFLTYEAAPAFDAALAVKQGECPLLWFAIFSEVHEADLAGTAASLPQDWQPSISEAVYIEHIRRIKEYIREGQTYQVNYTYRLQSGYDGAAFEAFRSLVRAGQFDYGAFIETPDFAVLSASPEIFFARQGESLISKPMKGTARRGNTPDEDHKLAGDLMACEKNRAENLMIVDMIRNDMGRIAQPGSVKVPRLFEVERYNTLWQMTSSVTCRSRAGLSEIMSALFPCASITGAPKVSTMRIIDELEDSPRGIYTGTIGFMGPERAQFNVAIRTLWFDKQKRSLEYGVGSGIVWDSDAQAEYIETKLKAQVLKRGNGFRLLETILWDGEFFLLDYHLARLTRSAACFGFECDLDAIRNQLDLDLSAPTRLRLLLAGDGQLMLEPHALASLPEPARLRFSPVNMRQGDIFLRHKTTIRDHYEQAKVSDCDDTVLLNEHGEVTETTIANIVIELDGCKLTPALQCGLLPGTMRQYLLDRGQIEEAVITREMLRRAEKIWLINSVRKWREAVLVD